MTTSIENEQLSAELQELYLLSKHWISDLDFLKGELDFLRKLYGRTFSPLIKKDDFEKIADILITAAKIDKAHVELRTAIPQYLHHLEKFIEDCDLNFEIDLIETHSLLESKINQLWLDFKSLKLIVFNLNNAGIKKAL